MFEPNELVNMVASLALFFYFYYLVRKGRCYRIPEIWLYGVFMVSFSTIASVVEGFIYPETVNFLEHASFMIGCFLFFIGAIQFSPNK